MERLRYTIGGFMALTAAVAFLLTLSLRIYVGAFVIACLIWFPYIISRSTTRVYRLAITGPRPFRPTSRG